MSAFSTKRVRQKDLSAQDISLKVEDLLKLTEASPFREAIIETLSVEDILSETVLISGINALAEAVDSESKKFLKFDVRLSFEDLEFFHLHDDNKIQFVFKNLAEVSFPNQTSDLVQSQVIETSSITAEPIYSAQNALFGKLFGFDKYANQLMGSGLSPVVLANLTMLNDIYREQGKALPKQEYRFRLLREEATGEYFFRALISAVRYQDYNIGVSVFIALVSLHQIAKGTGETYSIKSFDYTESFIKVVFESSQSLKLPNLGTAKFLVELSNSEITRGAVKLTGLCSVMSNVDEKKAEVQVSNKFQEPIFSISHGYGPQTAIKGMDVKEKLASVQKELFSDLEAINKANKEPGYLLQVFRSKISHGRTLDTTRKQQITKLLDRTVANFHELLVLMNKAEELVEDDVDAKDYLRYIMYSVLTDAK